jgi:hypothetical protein
MDTMNSTEANSSTFLVDWMRYIAPGEFRYCTDGKHLVKVHDQPCVVCTALKTLGQDAASFDRFKQGMAEHRELEAARLSLAKSREAMGLKPQWWL